MRRIVKAVEPHSLLQHRQLAYANYDNYTSKNHLRTALLSEQGEICCYCMRRIANNDMKIEHWHCQVNYPTEQLEYHNLLGACSGNEGKPWPEQTCDTRKADSDLSRNPADSTHDIEKIIRYLGNGWIEASDGLFSNEINCVLNLNHPFLIENRKAILDAFTRSLRKTGAMTKRQISKELGKWRADRPGQKRMPFCGVIVYYLQKRLDREA